MTVSEQVIYVDRFQLQEGKAEEFKQFAKEMTGFVEQNEPGTISFNYYVDEEGASGTAVFVFSDAEALDRHLDLAASRFQEGYGLLSAADIELLGWPSERAIDLVKSFNGKVKPKVAGFNR
jgi:quinol monooxygenase YgiN